MGDNVHDWDPPGKVSYTQRVNWFVGKLEKVEAAVKDLREDFNSLKQIPYYDQAQSKLEAIQRILDEEED